MITATVSILIWVKLRQRFPGLSSTQHIRKIFIILVILSLILLTSYYIQLKGTIRRPTSYIVETDGCRIPDLDPWDPLIRDYIKEPAAPFICNDGKPPLVKTELTRLFINRDAVLLYASNDQTLYCCYRPFWQSPHYLGNETQKVFSPTCNPFIDTVVNDDYVLVQCFTDEDKEVFRDYYAFIQVKSDIETRCGNIKSEFNDTDINVLILGIDGMSRNHLQRNMPRTLQLLQSLSAVDMSGNNVVGPHTIYNIAPLLTGLSVDELLASCWKEPAVSFDLCPWIYNNYSKAGYRTAYGENMAEWSVFINGRAGFQVPPTDYYLQPVFSLEQKWKEKHIKKNCFGTRVESQVLLDLMSDFLTTMTSKHFFGFFWDAHLTYHQYNLHPSYDIMYENILSKHLQSGIFNRTVLVFLSDHGYRWGDIHKTFQGLQEQKNPFLFFLFPEWFKEKYSLSMQNIYKNTKRLVTVYDAYETLLDILNHTHTMTDENCENRTLKLSESTVLPTGISLFLPIPESRTCTAAGIDSNLCLCQDMIPLNVSNLSVNAIASILIKDLSESVSKYPQCAKLELQEIHSAWIHGQKTDNLLQTDEGKIDDLTDYTVIIKTRPGGGLFEATYRYRPGSWSVLSSTQLVGKIQRISAYQNQSFCIEDAFLRPFCYCKS